MARSNIEGLRVYRLSEELADQIWNIVLSWDHFTRETIGKQLVRAVDSVGAKFLKEVGAVLFRITSVL